MLGEEDAPMLHRVTGTPIQGAAPRIVRDPALAVREARRMFFERDLVPEGLVSDKVLASWRRCRAAGLDPGERPDPDTLPRDELDTLRERHAVLLRAATPVVQEVAAHVDGEPNLVLLTDAAGFILMVAGNREFAVRARRRDVRPGLLLRESARGTNAPGACLHDARPLVVHGAEHYLSMYSLFTCSAAPICGPQGEVIGAIDLTGDARALQPYPLAIPCMAATLIEQQLFRLSYPMHALLRFHSRPEYIGALGEGLAALGDDGSVIAMNRAGLRLLGLERGAVIGHAFDATFDARFPDLCGLLRRAVQPVIRLHLRSGRRIYARIEGGDSAAFVPREPSARAAPAGDSAPALRQVEDDAVRRAVAAENGNLSAAARRLGIARTTLYRKLRRAQPAPAGCSVSRRIDGVD
jgi:transcriptional regulator of acetoin/glycerol metabolism